MRTGAALLAAALMGFSSPAPPSPAPLSPALPSADLAHAAWTRQGLQPDAAPAVVEPTQDAPYVELPFDAPGVRWACEFSTPDAATHRLHLRWRGAPDGLLYEVVLDGQRLSPPRDGWRPSSRELVADLGGVWLGRGRHLFEVVAREKPVEGTGWLRLAALELGEP